MDFNITDSIPYEPYANYSAAVWKATRGFRLMFYMVLPDEAVYEHTSDVPDYTQEAIPYFISMMLVEAIILYLTNRGFPRANDTINSMTMGLLLLISQLAFLPVGLLTYSWVHTHYCLYQLPWHSPWTWWIAVITFDCGYYWFHRMAHEISLFWAAHQTHHSSEEYNLSTALRQSVVQSFTSWPFYLPIALFVPPSIFLVHRQLNLLYQFWIHTEMVKTMGPLEYILNTPSHHRVHHGRNPYCIDKNYAGMLIIWDRMFGTFQPEGDRVVYGLVSPLATWNPITAQFGSYIKLWKRFYEMPGFYNKLCVLFKGPGWSPGTPRLGDHKCIPEVHYDPKQKYHLPTPLWLDIYCYVHFFLVLFAVHTLSQRKALLAPMLLLALLGYCVFCLTSIGLLFDRHPLAPITEITRLAAMLLLDWLTMGTASTGVLGGGVWVLRGLVILSISTWLLLSCKLLIPPIATAQKKEQ